MIFERGDIMREWTIEHGLQAFLDLMWYAGQEQHVLYVSRHIKKNAKNNPGYNIMNDYYIQQNCRDLWGMLVLLYGEYGTSPFSGWIEPKYAADAIYNLDYWLKDYPIKGEET